MEKGCFTDTNELSGNHYGIIYIVCARMYVRDYMETIRIEIEAIRFCGMLEALKDAYFCTRDESIADLLTQVEKSPQELTPNLKDALYKNNPVVTLPLDKWKVILNSLEHMDRKTRHSDNYTIFYYMLYNSLRDEINKTVCAV